MLKSASARSGCSKAMQAMCTAGSNRMRLLHTGGVASHRVSPGRHREKRLPTPPTSAPRLKRHPRTSTAAHAQTQTQTRPDRQVASRRVASLRSRSAAAARRQASLSTGRGRARHHRFPLPLPRPTGNLPGGGHFDTSRLLLLRGEIPRGEGVDCDPSCTLPKGPPQRSCAMLVLSKVAMK